MSYKIGQVVYVILRKEAMVFPMQCVEILTKRTLDGEITTYMLRAGADPLKVLSMSDIDGEIFDSAEKAKSTLIDRVTSAVTQRVEQAIEKAKTWYAGGFESVVDDPLTLLKKSGVTHSSPPPLPQKPKQAMKPEVAELAAQFAAEAEASMIELPDGTKAKVKSVKMPPTMQG